MKTMIQIWTNPTFGEIRTMIDEKGNTWFVGKDVALALGYKDSVNAMKMHVEDEDKLGWQITTSGQKRQVTFINESGLYALVLSSKQPQAHECTVEELAKMIRNAGVQIGQNRLFGWLRNNHYLGHSKAHFNIPYQEYIDQGLFKLRITEYNFDESTPIHVSLQYMK